MSRIQYVPRRGILSDGFGARKGRCTAVAKKKIIVFVEPVTIRSYDGFAETLQVPRSEAFRMGLEAGLPYVRQEVGRRQSRRPVSRRTQAVADLPQAYAALQRFGATLVSVNRAITEEVLKSHLVEEAAAQRPRVVLSDQDFDDLVDQLLDADTGDLTPVPGDGTPGDDMEM